MAFMLPVVRRPLDYNGMTPGFPGGRGNLYRSPYSWRPEPSPFPNAHIRIPRTPRSFRERQPRQFGRSYRWGTSLGGHRPRPFQSPLGYHHGPFSTQPRYSPYTARMPPTRYPPMRSPMHPPMHQIRPLRPIHGSRYGNPYDRFSIPPMPRNHTSQRPMYGRYDSYRSYRSDDEDEDDDDVLGDDDDDIWGESDTEDSYGWDSGTRSDDDYYDDCSTRRSPSSMYSSYTGYSSRYRDYGDDSFSDTTYSHPSYSCSHASPYGRYPTW